MFIIAARLLSSRGDERRSRVQREERGRVDAAAVKKSGAEGSRRRSLQHCIHEIVTFSPSLFLLPSLSLFLITQRRVCVCAGAVRCTVLYSRCIYIRPVVYNIYIRCCLRVLYREERVCDRLGRVPRVDCLLGRCGRECIYTLLSVSLSLSPYLSFSLSRPL